MTKIFNNLWRILLVPGFLFLFMGIEIIMQFTNKENLVLILLSFLISTISFGMYFISELLQRNSKSSVIKPAR